MNPKPDLPSVVYHGQTYWLPFADALRKLNTRERRLLRATIVLYGVLDPVMTYDSPTHGERCVIDGANRLRIGVELQKHVPIKHFGPMSDVEAWERAEAKNFARRQISQAVLRTHDNDRVARIERVKLAILAGASLRDAARAESISHETVRRYLSQDENVTVTVADPSEQPDPLTTARSALAQCRDSVAMVLGSDLGPHLTRVLERHGATNALAVTDAALADLEYERAIGFG